MVSQRACNEIAMGLHNPKLTDSKRNAIVYQTVPVQDSQPSYFSHYELTVTRALGCPDIIL